MGYVGLLLFLIVYVYAVLGTHLFKATDPQHFGHLGLAFLSLFQIITLEGWAEIFRPQFEIYGWPAVVYFVSFILLGTMILLNLLIGVVLRSMEQVQSELHRRDGDFNCAKQGLEEIQALSCALNEKIEKLRRSQPSS
jgi:voltage-gated sodium channel